MALFFHRHDVQLALSYSCHPNVSHGEWWIVFNFNPHFFVFYYLRSVSDAAEGLPHDDGAFTDMSVLTVKR